MSPTKKGRGRPAGSTNKPKVVLTAKIVAKNIHSAAVAAVVDENYTDATLEEYARWMELHDSVNNAGSQKSEINGIKSIMMNIKETSLVNAIQNKRDKIAQFIEGTLPGVKQKYALNTRNGSCKKLITCMKHFPPIIAMPSYAEDLAFFEKLHRKMLVMYSMQQKDKEDEYVPNIDDMNISIQNTFKKNSKERILGEYYCWWSMRDDFPETKLVRTRAETLLDKSVNYMICPPSVNNSFLDEVWFQNNVYKTSKHYGPLERQLPPALAAQFRAYFKDNKITYFIDSGKYIFGKTALSKTIGDIFEQAGYPGVTIRTIRTAQQIKARKTGDPAIIAECNYWLAHTDTVANQSYIGRDINSSSFYNKGGNNNNCDCEEGERCCCCCEKIN
jgi:hypothetical protein